MEETPVKDDSGKITFVVRRVKFSVEVVYGNGYTLVSCALCHKVIFHSDTVRLAPEEIIKQAFAGHSH